MSFSTIVPGAAAVVLYLAGTFLQGRALTRNAALPSWGLRALVLPALVLHSIAAYGIIALPQGINLSLASVTSLTALIVLAMVVAAGVARPVHSLFVLLFPLAALALLASLFLQRDQAPADGLTDVLAVHVLVSVLAYSILLMAALQSILVGIAERNIRAKSRILMLRILPPLETMEHLLFVMLWVGFAGLTVAIASGFIYLDDMFAQHVVHHTVLSSASWVVYVVLLVGRMAFGWRGTAAVRWTLSAFALLLLGYFGSKFVLEVLLQRG
ncbi:MAG: cytochrome c biogenesis protein CcsA [Gammaproteobacteria bacterium]|nr:cytochrome c biogenesis protein CcsA [Gammaproteobacteria bacterium]